MKKLFLILPLGLGFVSSCGNSGETEVNNDALNEVMESQDDFVEATISFEEGGATTGEEYFFGVQAEVVEIDVKLREIDDLDEMDATEEEFTTQLDTMLAMIEHCKKAMDLYAGKDWPKRQELHDLTIEWVDAVAMLVNDHLRGLAKPMSTPDDKWTKKENALYDKYLDAYEVYSEIDGRWVDFQYVYADANGFELSDEGIDMDALIEEDMEASGH
ncbi:MAG: hypothetical protein IPG07_17260 [Crocinitomicaceae bacterium]|jgi:hypothetical protein|nr:hypothetical protein [Crocinitomicaceae bacterium]